MAYDGLRRVTAVNGGPVERRYVYRDDDGSPHDKNNNNQGKLPKWLQKVLKSKTGGTIMAIEVPSLRKPEPNIGQRERIIPLQMELLLFGHTVHL